MTDWEEQRRSFAYGNTNIDNPDVTRGMVDAAADKLTETPPIIDRLDAVKRDENVAFAGMLEREYESLRALVLRLQEERDRAIQQRDSEERVANAKSDLAVEMDTLRCNAVRERDALLEALKRARGRLDFVVNGDDSPADPVTAASRASWKTTSRASANTWRAPMSTYRAKVRAGQPDEPLRFICPRECPSPHTDHCVGTDNGPHLRCDFCGKYMPTEAKGECAMTKVTAKRNKHRAKDDENEVARILGGVRHWADSGGPEDVHHEWMVVQVRGGLRVANETIRDGMAKAKAGTGNATKLPALVLVDRSGTRIRRYIMFELEQFADWHGLGEVGDD